MELNPIVLSIPIYFILIAIEWVYDLYKGTGVYRLGDATANISCGIVQQVSGLFAKVFTVGLFFWVHQHFALFEIPVNAFTAILLWLGVDLCYYWAHRHSHTINLFWIGHSIHHQSEDYNLSVALRQGSFQVVFTAWYYIPLAVLGFDPKTFLFVSALNTLYQFWIHTEFIKNMGPFEYVFNTPSHHRVHHARNPKYIDKNHAGSLIIWDKMFGTFAKEEEHPTYGVTIPTHTFDPVEAHAKPIINLWSDIKRVPGIKNKIKLLFMPPGWYPVEIGGFKKPEEVGSNFKKFDVPLWMSLKTYLGVQYLILLGLVALFLFQVSKFSTVETFVGATSIVLSVMALGRLFSLKNDGFIWEGTRLFICLISIAVLLPFNEHSQALMALGAASAAWFFVEYNRSRKFLSTLNRG
jgi:alkylglycerol monooxygenase